MARDWKDGEAVPPPKVYSPWWAECVNVNASWKHRYAEQQPGSIEMVYTVCKALQSFPIRVALRCVGY